MFNVAPTSIDLADARTQRALIIAADAGQWARCTSRSGRSFFAIPSGRKAELRYFADTSSCTCPDAKYRPWATCKHILAVRIHEVLAS